MKVALITERTDVTLGGAERSVAELGEALAGAGVDVTTIAATGRPTNQDTRIVFPKATKRVPLSKFKVSLQKHFKKHHYDIIHSVIPFRFVDVYQPRGGSYAEAIIRNAASYQSRSLQTYKKITARANRRRSALLKSEKALCKDSAGPVVAALSDYVADQFKNHYALDDRRITIIRNGIRIPAQFDHNEADRLREEVFRQCKITKREKPVILLFAANNFRLKGLKPLIKALAVSLADYEARRICLFVAGRSNPRPFQRLGANLGIGNNLAFFTEPLDIFCALSASQVAVLPTFYDPCSRFILEALALAKPVITTRFNGAVDFLVNSRHGKVVDSPENISALAQAITYFSTLRNINMACRAVVEDELARVISIERVVNEFLALYESVLKRSKTSGSAGGVFEAGSNNT